MRCGRGQTKRRVKDGIATGTERGDRSFDDGGAGRCGGVWSQERRRIESNSAVASGKCETNLALGDGGTGAADDEERSRRFNPSNGNGFAKETCLA